MLTSLDVCVPSLRRGHASLPCIAPCLKDDPRRVDCKHANMREGYFAGPPLRTPLVSLASCPSRRYLTLGRIGTKELRADSLDGNADRHELGERLTARLAP
jgi:hypothetical protein